MPLGQLNPACLQNYYKQFIFPMHTQLYHMESSFAVTHTSVLTYLKSKKGQETDHKHRQARLMSSTVQTIENTTTAFSIYIFTTCSR